MERRILRGINMRSVSQSVRQRPRPPSGHVVIRIDVSTPASGADPAVQPGDISLSSGKIKKKLDNPCLLVYFFCVILPLPSHFFTAYLQTAPRFRHPWLHELPRSASFFQIRPIRFSAVCLRLSGSGRNP